jgi:hypothetical protein
MNTQRDPVEAQLEAYNARDIQRFVACFTEDVCVEDGAGTCLMSGIEEFRMRYATMFDANPKLHCEVRQRMRAGVYVVDEEYVTGRGEETLHVIVEYTLRGHHIARVRILR